MRAAVLALTVTGCSFAFTSNPPPPCNRSSIAPIADTAVATLAAIGTVYFAATDEPIGAAIEGGMTLAFAASAYTGFRRVGRCRAVTP
jgi:hypothetical protein